MHDYSGQTVFITGAAAGIGLGMAKAFYGAGASVVLVVCQASKAG